MYPGCYLLFVPLRLAVITRIAPSEIEYEWHEAGGRRRGILVKYSMADFADLGRYNQKRIFGHRNQTVTLQQLKWALALMVADLRAKEEAALALKSQRMAREQAEHARKQAELERRRAKQEEQAREQAALDDSRRIKFEAFQQVERKLEQDYIGANADWHEHPSSCLSEDDFNECRSGFVRKWSQQYPDLGLDDEQAAAVAEWGPHIQVTARAGSGKTRSRSCAL